MTIPPFQAKIIHTSTPNIAIFGKVDPHLYEGGRKLAMWIVPQYKKQHVL